MSRFRITSGTLLSVSHSGYSISSSNNHLAGRAPLHNKNTEYAVRSLLPRITPVVHNTLKGPPRVYKAWAP